MIKTCKKCWKVKDPGVLCFEDMWEGGLRAPWLNISHEHECNPDHSSAAVWLDGGGRGDAGELLPNTRGSSSLGEMEGLRERRGEHSFKALWRLAAVGRAAVFPKSPPNRKTVSFFPLHKSNLYPTAESEGQLWTQRGKKNPQIILLSAWYTHRVVHVALKHTRCWWTNTCSLLDPSAHAHTCRHISKTCQRWWLIRPVSRSSVCPVSLPISISTSTPSPSKRLARSGWPKVQRSAVSLCKGEKLIAYITVWLHLNMWFVIVYQLFSLCCI